MLVSRHFDRWRDVGESDVEEERSEMRLNEVGSLRLAETTGRRVRCCACQLGCCEVGVLAARKVATANRNRQPPGGFINMLF